MLFAIIIIMTRNICIVSLNIMYIHGPLYRGYGLPASLEPYIIYTLENTSKTYVDSHPPTPEDRYIYCFRLLDALYTNNELRDS